MVTSMTAAVTMLGAEVGTGADSGNLGAPASAAGMRAAVKASLEVAGVAMSVVSGKLGLLDPGLDRSFKARSL
jgi:hypothetical protein